MNHKLIEEYTQRLENPNLNIEEKTELYCLRSVARTLNIRKDRETYESVNKHFLVSLDNIMASYHKEENSQREEDYHDFASVILLYKVDEVCDHKDYFSIDYSVPKDLQKHFAKQAESFSGDNYLADFEQDAVPRLQLSYLHEFIGKFFRMEDKLPGLQPASLREIDTERIMGK